MTRTDYSQIVDDAAIAQTIKALEQNGFHALQVSNLAAAKAAALELMPKGAEVFAVTSKTLDATGLRDVIDESGDYVSVRKKLVELSDRDDAEKEKKQLGSAPDYVIGSAHALTEDGKILVASGTGSQLAAEVYGAEHVIYVVGAQKIVQDLQEGIERIETYIVPLESKRIQEVYNNKDAQTNFSRLFIYNKNSYDRDVQIIIVKENVGF